jgi:hypothetical protein
MPVQVRADVGVPYGLGKLMDIYLPAGPEPCPSVLLWHGRGPDERDVLAPLARIVAGCGVNVFVPDWDSGAADGGRAQLLCSLAITRARAAAFDGGEGRVTLAGWSLGARSAAGVAVRPDVVGGWRPAAVICLAGGFAVHPAPPTGSPPLDDLRQGGTSPVPFWLVHGTQDPVVGVARSREFAAELARQGWPARLEEPATDHAGVVMAEYAPELGRARPARSGHALAAGRLAAAVIAEAASTPGPHDTGESPPGGSQSPPARRG